MMRTRIRRDTLEISPEGFRNSICVYQRAQHRECVAIRGQRDFTMASIKLCLRDRDLRPGLSRLELKRVLILSQRTLKIVRVAIGVGERDVTCRIAGCLLNQRGHKVFGRVCRLRSKCQKQAITSPVGEPRLTDKLPLRVRFVRELISDAERSKRRVKGARRAWRIIVEVE